MFRSLSETFVRSCSVLLVLATVVMWRGKKSVVHVAQCIAAVVPVHRTPSLADVHCFLNPSGTSIRLPIQDCRFWPVDYMVVVACMISHRWFILFWQTYLVYVLTVHCLRMLSLTAHRSQLNITASAVDSSLEGGAQKQQTLNVECVHDYNEPPLLTLHFL